MEHDMDDAQPAPPSTAVCTHRLVVSSPSKDGHASPGSPEVMSVLGGKASCRRKFVLHVQLTDDQVRRGGGSRHAVRVQAASDLRHTCPTLSAVPPAFLHSPHVRLDSFSVAPCVQGNPVSKDLAVTASLTYSHDCRYPRPFRPLPSTPSPPPRPLPPTPSPPPPPSPPSALSPLRPLPSHSPSHQPALSPSRGIQSFMHLLFLLPPRLSPSATCSYLSSSHSPIPYHPLRYCPLPHNLPPLPPLRMSSAVKLEEGQAMVEPPLFTTFNGVEFPAHLRPSQMLAGRATFKLALSVLSSKCDNRLFAVCFTAATPLNAPTPLNADGSPLLVAPGYSRAIRSALPPMPARTHAPHLHASPFLSTTPLPSVLPASLASGPATLAPAPLLPAGAAVTAMRAAAVRATAVQGRAVMAATATTAATGCIWRPTGCSCRPSSPSSPPCTSPPGNTPHLPAPPLPISAPLALHRFCRSPPLFHPASERPCFPHLHCPTQSLSLPFSPIPFLISPLPSSRPLLFPPASSLSPAPRRWRGKASHEFITSPVADVAHDLPSWRMCPSPSAPLLCPSPSSLLPSPQGPHKPRSLPPTPSLPIPSPTGGVAHSPSPRAAAAAAAMPSPSPRAFSTSAPSPTGTVGSTSAMSAHGSPAIAARPSPSLPPRSSPSIAPRPSPAAPSPAAPSPAPSPAPVAPSRAPSPSLDSSMAGSSGCHVSSEQMMSQGATYSQSYSGCYSRPPADAFAAPSMPGAGCGVGERGEEAAAAYGEASAMVPTGQFTGQFTGQSADQSALLYRHVPLQQIPEQPAEFLVQSEQCTWQQPLQHAVKMETDGEEEGEGMHEGQHHGSGGGHGHGDGHADRDGKEGVKGCGDGYAADLQVPSLPLAHINTSLHPHHHRPHHPLHHTHAHHQHQHQHQQLSALLSEESFQGSLSPFNSPLADPLFGPLMSPFSLSPGPGLPAMPLLDPFKLFPPAAAATIAPAAAALEQCACSPLLGGAGGGAQGGGGGEEGEGGGEEEGWIEAPPRPSLRANQSLSAFSPYRSPRSCTISPSSRGPNLSPLPRTASPRTMSPRLLSPGMLSPLGRVLAHFGSPRGAMGAALWGEGAGAGGRAGGKEGLGMDVKGEWGKESSSL
ncbi:unnamed protein product [Closterium sp. Naga37s-1]|nr:unnamed protein product [Closterium sp. Naga37s-1]